MRTLFPLTAGEHLSIMRRRLGWTQPQAARACGVSLIRWQRWENDVSHTVPPGLVLAAQVTVPHAGELARVWRRRLGWTVRDAGRRLGWSHLRVIRAEHDQPAGSGAVLLRGLGGSGAVLLPPTRII